MKLTEKLLTGMYDLPHREAAFIQDPTMCQEYLEVFCSALNRLLDMGDEAPGWCTREELKILDACQAMMKDSRVIRWLRFLPKYGSLVIARSPEDPDTVFVKVLGLDDYRLDLHWNSSRQKYEYTPHPYDYIVLDVALLQESKLEPLKERFDRFLSDVQGRTGDARTAAGNKQGHQFTASFIQALLKQAKSESTKEVLPQGGFTDNGLHTGGKPRNTSFPLVRSFFHYCMVQSGDKGGSLYCRFLSYLDIYIANEWLDSVQKEDPKCIANTRIYLDWTSRIIQAAALKFKGLGKLDTSQCKLATLFKYAESVETTLEMIKESLQDAEAEKYVIDEKVTAKISEPNAFRGPVLSLDPDEPSPEPVKSVEERRKQAAKDIDTVTINEDGNAFDVHKMLDWMNSPQVQCDSNVHHAHLVIGTIEETSGAVWREDLKPILWMHLVFWC